MPLENNTESENIIENSILKHALSIGVTLVLCTLIILGVFYFKLVKAPSGRTQESYPIRVVIEQGQNAASIAAELKEQQVISSAGFLRRLILFRGKSVRISSGTYIFENPSTVFTVMDRLIKSDFGYTPVKVTVPEGMNVKSLTRLISEKFPHLSADQFALESAKYEGYLFPETYFFEPSATSSAIIARMTSMFDQMITKHLPEFTTLSESQRRDTIILASILEEEVQTYEDKQMVADLLMHRMKIGMALQVDATLAYRFGKTSAELRADDLKSEDPYNTYTHRGLPPTPISNPGLESIRAALNPLPNPYLFYLSDKNGITHFSKTHEEHVKLKATYLR